MIWQYPESGEENYVDNIIFSSNSKKKNNNDNNNNNNVSSGQGQTSVSRSIPAVYHYEADIRKRKRLSSTSERRGGKKVVDTDAFIRARIGQPGKPILFVIDFDHTLAVYDSELLLEDNRAEGEEDFASLYTRPFMFQFLNFIKKVNKNNVIILWTKGQKMYIQRAVLILGIANFFDHILSRKDCERSKMKYNMYKSMEYINELFPDYSKMTSVLIDDYAFINGSGKPKYKLKSSYSELIKVEPYLIENVLQFNDNVLLNLMLYLDSEYFFSSELFHSAKNSIYNVITLGEDKKSLVLTKKSDVSKCQLLISSW